MISFLLFLSTERKSLSADGTKQKKAKLRRGLLLSLLPMVLDHKVTEVDLQRSKRKWSCVENMTTNLRSPSVNCSVPHNKLKKKN